jgi:hypothetical protein
MSVVEERRQMDSLLGVWQRKGNAHEKEVKGSKKN